MNGRLRLAAVAALTAAVVAVGAVLAFDGGSAGADAGRLGWNGQPFVFEARGLPGDFVLSGQLRVAGREPVELDVTKVRVLDAEGDELKSSVRFIAAFAHGLYPPDERDESQIGDGEKRRLGEIATLGGDRALPITLSWRVPEGGSPAARVDFGPAALALPAPSPSPAPAR